MKSLYLDDARNEELIISYGEFSIGHWIDLLLSKRLLLPEYQRQFVWEPYRVIELYKSIIEKSYVPPVLIAHRMSKNSIGDYILDGQQRLTALLLLYLRVYPNYDKTIFESEDVSFNIDWTMNKLLRVDDNYSNSEKEVCEIINSGNAENVAQKLSSTNLYRKLDEEGLYGAWYKRNEDVIKNCDFRKICSDFSLGFCYIRFRKPNSKFENKGYAKIFKSINSNGVPLSDMESRRALFWSCEDNKNYNDFFEPEGFKNVYVDNKKIDIVSLLAYVAERASGEVRFAMNRRNDSSRQTYYNEYVESVLYDEDSSIFGKFSSIITDKDGAMKKVVDFYQTHLSKEINDKFENIMHAQITMFGLLYWTIYKGKDIGWDNRIIYEINNYKKSHNDYTKYRNITEFRDRMTQSINIYGKFIKEKM